MNLRDFTRIATPTGWASIAAVGAIILILAVGGWWMLTEPGRQRAAANLAGASQVVSDARAASGADAVSVVTKNAASEREIDQQSTENRDAILNVPGASAPVDPAVGDAGRRAVCLRKSARCLPGCVRLLGPCPR